MRPKQLLQRVVGARQVCHAITMEQAEAVAGRHLHEVVDGASQRAGCVAPRGPSRQQALVADLHTDSIELGLIGKDMGGRMEPAMRTADVCMLVVSECSLICYLLDSTLYYLYII